MIKSLDIQNFQSHANTNLEFSPGLSVLIGSNDAGKSSIIRGLLWVFRNRPRGKSFIRHGSNGECIFTIHMDDDTIERYRKGSTNTYTLNDEEPFEALGSDVPQEIADRLNIQEINVAAQLDGHFLVLDSPGKIASALNDVVHLDEAERCADELSGDIRQNKREADRLQELEKTLETSLSLYHKLPVYSHRVEEANALQTSLTASRATRQDLIEWLSEVWAVDEILATITVPEGMDEKIGEVEKLYAECREMTLNVCSLDAHVDNLLQITAELQVLRDVDKGQEIYDEMSGRLAELDRTEVERDDLSELVAKIQVEEEVIIDLDDEVGRMEGVYNSLLEKIENCPVCGQELDDKHRQMVLENLK
ncbi:hypothetical protein LCGC14_0235180 [marine sediment metagenome]|uniref:Endonuclease GajA/Old nuclease/RecF-like AAA domain-containing protein n=1 Tax=marine sediment metagenome TaxID=412755 RepID=A0A0F9UQ70_9ZZZZ